MVQGELVVTAVHLDAVDNKEATILGHNHTLVFSMDLANETQQRVFESTHVLQVTNTGSYRVAINAIKLVYTRDGVEQQSTSLSGFTLPAMQDVMLEPADSLDLQIEFVADCYRARQQNQLDIVTRDSVTSIHLIGHLTVPQAFDCRMQQRSMMTAQYVLVLSGVILTAAISIALLALGMVWYHAMRRRRGSVDPTMTPVQLKPSVPHHGVESGKTNSDLLKMIGQIEAASSQRNLTARKTSRVEKLRATRRLKEKQLKTRPKEAKLEQGAEDLTVTPPIVTPEIVTIAATHEESVASVEATQIAALTTHASDPIISDTRVEMTELVKPTEEIPLPPPQLESVPLRDAAIQLHSDSDNQASSPRETQRDVDTRDAAKTTKDRTLAEHPHSNQEEEKELRELVSVKANAEENKDVDDANDAGSTRDDTVSEEESDNQALEGESDPSDPTAWPIEDLLEKAPDDLVFVATTSVVEDDWSGLSFDSLQSEIGRLLIGDDTTDTTPFNPLISATSLPFPAVQRANEPPHITTSSSGGGGVLNALSMAPPQLPMSSLFGGNAMSLHTSISAANKKSAPPGFSPADADPEASRAAFERLTQQQQTLAPPSAFKANGQRNAPVFGGRYSLFGSALEPEDPSTPRPLAGIGHIGGNRAGRGGATASPFASPLQVAALGGAREPPSKDHEDSRFKGLR